MELLIMSSFIYNHPILTIIIIIFVIGSLGAGSKDKSKVSKRMSSQSGFKPIKSAVAASSGMISAATMYEKGCLWHVKMGCFIIIILIIIGFFIAMVFFGALSKQNNQKNTNHTNSYNNGRIQNISDSNTLELTQELYQKYKVWILRLRNFSRRTNQMFNHLNRI